MLVKSIQNKYSLIEIFSLVYSVILTKLRFPGQRIIRPGLICRGRKMIKWGFQLTTGIGCRIEAFIADDNKDTKIVLGNRIQLNDYVHISALKHIEIGDDVLMASHIYISDNSHGCYKGNGEDTSPAIPPIKRPYYVAPVKIGSNVWLGEGVIVLPGVTIGDGSIVGAHSVVTSNIPSNCIAVGSPAKIIKIWNNESKHWEKYNL